MPVSGSVDVALDIFGGLVTDMAPADLPAGVSPDCQDVAFIPGSVKSRPGLNSVFPAISGNPSVNYLKTYIPPTGLLRLLALDAAGSLWKESSIGVLSLISSTIVPASYGKSTSLFTREYLAIGDGKYGIDLPRQYDDTFLDRVSQGGPGAPPTVTDSLFTANVIASPNGATQFASASITAISETDNVVTVTTSGAYGLNIVGESVVISGVPVAGYNGTFPVAKVISSTQFTYINSTLNLAASSGGTVASQTATIETDLAAFVFGHLNNPFSTGQTVVISGVTVGGYNGTWKVIGTFTYGSLPIKQGIYVTTASTGLAVSGSGTVSDSGNVTAGVHQCTVSFVTRQGYITAPAVAPVSFTAAGGKRVIVANIPIGPSNVTGRIVMFTPVGQAFFFYSSGIEGVFSSNFIINDNTTTTATFDFTDNGLAAGISADYLFKLLVLGECSGCIGYASRLFWWGERNKIDNLVNMGFDGGFSNPGSSPNFPLGWTQDATSSAGGGSAVALGLPAVFGDAYAITGDGATAVRGKIKQSSVSDYLGEPILSLNTAYSVRARIARNSTLAAGTLHINLDSFVGSGISVAAGSLTTSYQEFIAPLTTSGTGTVLQVYADGTPTNGGTFLIDSIEIFPTNQPFDASTVRASISESPESYDGVTGFLSVSENDGFAVRSAFVIRENLYFVKEHGIYVTQDDGTNEPSGWTITEVSRKVGTISVNGVGVGEDWAVIADRSGLYLTTGGEPTKISQEIQPTWDRINWAAGQTLWVQVDLQNRRILVGVPLDGATKPNYILTVDYRGTNTVAELMDSGPIHTTYTGKLMVLEKSRKWSIWTIAANSAAIVERFDGTQKFFVGNGTAKGKIYQLLDEQFTDDGAFIPSYYDTYYHFTHDLEQAFQIGSHNKLFNYMSMNAEGNAQLSVSAVLPIGRIQPMASIGLINPALRDIEFPVNVTSERCAFRVAVSNTGDWFRLARFIVNATQSPTSPTRGWN